MKNENHKSLQKGTFQVQVSKLQVEYMIYIKYLIIWAKEMMSSNLWTHGENWPQRFGLSLSLYDLSFVIMVPGEWQIFRADCAVILRYCKSKLDQKCRSYLTLKHLRILNLQFPQFFKGLKRGLLTKIRCSQWLQGMVLYGTKGFQAKKSKSMTFNYKSCISYLVLALNINW